MSERMQGKLVPDISSHSSEGKEVSLQDYAGKNVVLYFYPRDMTPGCTTESCDFRDYHAGFHDLNTVVLGVSADDLVSHDKFIAKHDLPFALLADTEHELAEYFGVWVTKKMYGKESQGIERSTFVIDTQGKVVKQWNKVKVDGHVQEVYDYINEDLT